MKSAVPGRLVLAEMLKLGWSGTDRRASNGSLKRWLLWSVLVLPIFTPLAALDAAAQQSRPQYYTKPSGGISLEQAADMVRRQTGGRVLSASPVNKSGQRGYNVRVLVDGKRVKQYYVDAEGRMSSR